MLFFSTEISSPQLSDPRLETIRDFSDAERLEMTKKIPVISIGILSGALSERKHGCVFASCGAVHHFPRKRREKSGLTPPERTRQLWTAVPLPLFALQRPLTKMHNRNYHFLFSKYFTRNERL